MTNARSRRIGLAAKLALAFASLCLSLGVLEIAVRLTGFQPLYAVYSKPSVFWIHDPLLGWAHEPGASGTYVGPRPWPVEFRGEVSINSLGLRGPELSPPLPGERRVLFLGDSVTAGFEVDDQATFAARLGPMLSERMGAPVSTINAGVRAYGTDQAYLYFREHGHRLAPDAVVFLHSSNDPEDNITLHRMRRPFGKAAFAMRNGNELELVGSPVPDFPLCSERKLDGASRVVATDTAWMRFNCSLAMNFSDHSALFTLAAMTLRSNPELVQRLYHLGTPPKSTRARRGNDHPTRLTRRLLHALSDEAERHGAPMLLVASGKQIERIRLDEFEAGGMPVFRLLTGIAPEEDAAIRYRNDSHFNEAGHLRVADELLEPIAALLERSAGR